LLSNTPEKLTTLLLEVIEREIVPLTTLAVQKGNKIFGAAILKKSDGALVVAGTNRETECPLWHGEVSTIKKLYELPSSQRPRPQDCIFLSTHEPCSLCLSAITWAGYDNFYYLFSHQDSRDSFNIPHDLRILEQVFGCRNGEYARSNAYWESHSIAQLVAGCGTAARSALESRIEDLESNYADLSATYQLSKSGNEIPLS
jgi:tRNA(Arg) A34 adenosine deaminase TadA